jgi:hypothetical protein
MPLKTKQKTELRPTHRHITQSSNAKKTCHDYFIAKKIGRNDLCRNFTSYADLVIKPKPQGQMGQQHSGCQGVWKGAASLINGGSHPSSLAEESSSSSITSGGAVKAKVLIKCYDLPSSLQNRLLSKESNHEVTVNNNHHQRKPKGTITMPKQSSKNAGQFELSSLYNPVLQEAAAVSTQKENAHSEQLASMCHTATMQ